VTTPAGTSAAVTADQYTYKVLPQAVTKVSPTSGPTTGGTTVTFTGTGFTGATKVLLGAATSFSVVSATQITAVSPAQAVTAAQFTYVAAA
jgi:IPT/TIG domain